MHRLVYRRRTSADINAIIRYYETEKKNFLFAVKLADELEEAIKSLRRFPYINPVHISGIRLKHEYRKLLVRNYLVFYWIQEESKTVIIYRVLYAGMDYDRFL